jgi:hypothetical protein
MRAVRRSAGGVLLAAVLVLGGCGDDAGTGSAEDPSSPAGSSSSEAGEPSTEPTTEPTDSEPTDSESSGGGESEPTSPTCAEVWVADQPFPRKYAGCFDEEKGRWVQAMVYRCSSGQQLVTYRRTFYATKGGQVVETAGPLARDPEFTKALATCGA